MIRRLFLIGAVAFATGLSVGAEEETYKSLTVGKETYTNVTVMSKTAVDLFIKHAHGMANLKVRDLDPATQTRLGYVVEQPKPTKVEKIIQASDMSRFEADPRIQEMEALAAAQFAEAIENVDEKAYYWFVGGSIFVYLVYCFLCRLICVKTSNPPSPLIWIPFLKQIPLFKAAGMS